MKSPQERSVDPAAVEMLQHAASQNLEVAWDRYEAQLPQCGFGQLGICCRNCTMGPCRIDPFGDGPSEGICGAGAEIIAARNVARMIAAGAAAHSDHGRDVVYALKLAAEGGDYTIKDPVKLRKLAAEWGLPTEGKSIAELARAVAELASAEFGKQDGQLRFVQRAPEETRKRWTAAKVTPRGIDREVVDILHRTHVGGDNEMRSILLAGVRTALADGWGGSMIATELSDIVFKSPHWIRSRVNLGVIEPKNVNILVHGHEPVLSEMIVAACQDKELVALAKSKGAEGITLAGICCTANEILMRHGVPVAGNFLHQELAIATGAVDAMVVDIQCVLPAVAKLATCFHTKFISTSKKANFPFAQRVEFHEEKALSIARQIVRIAIENFPNRDKSRVVVPGYSSPAVVGFTTENVFDALGGRYRPSYRPLNDAVITGRLRGVAAVVGCNNPKHQQDSGHLAMTRELLANDVLVATTGCTAIADAKAGLLCPEAAAEVAGQGLQEICRAVGIPPVLHFGAYVDISRILIVLSNMVAEGGLGTSIADLPAAAAAPEWMSEKAVAIGFYAVASGALVVLGGPLPIQGSTAVDDYLTRGIAEEFGGRFAFQGDPIQAARLMIDHIDERRAALHLPGPMYEVPYAPKTVENAVASVG